MTTASAISDITAEAGVIASVVLKPEFTFYSEQLRPNHFTDPQNAYIYYAVCELAKAGIENVDAYNIFNQLHANSIAKRAIEGIQQSSDTITIQAVNDLIDIAPTIARATVEEYMSLVNNVLGAAFRRNTYEKLIECQKLCFDSSCEDIEQKIYGTLDGVMMEFASKNEVPQYKDVVDDMWQQIESRQGQDGISGIPFKFPTLNAYCTIEPGELFIVAAGAKQGKSMFLLNCAVDLLKQDLGVLYLDSELNTRMFTCRLISNLTNIEYRRLKAGRYDDGEKERIDAAIAWLKTRSFTHLYMPMFDIQSIYSVVKKVMHISKLNVVIFDYFKSSGEGDAFASYQELGKATNFAKNIICGSLNLCGIGAAQATASGKVADSAKIGRNASTIALLQDKTPDEIQQDGAECGNKKLKIVLNRNGAQMSDGEYIDLMFRGDFVSYEEAKQHIPVTPF